VLIIYPADFFIFRTPACDRQTDGQTDGLQIRGTSIGYTALAYRRA